MKQALAALAAGATLLGCGASRLGSAVEALRATPSSLLFPTTFIGYRSAKEIAIENSGTVPEEVTIDVKQPFAADQEAFQLEAGRTRVVHVSFAPTTSGRMSSTLT